MREHREQGGFLFAPGMTSQRWSTALDITQLSQLPLTVLVILGAYWVIQRHNDEFAKKLIELIGQFSEKYTALIDRAAEEREEARQRWMQRDQQLVALIIDVKDTMSHSYSELAAAMQNEASQNHTLRTTLQPLVLWWEAERRGTKRQRGGDTDAAS